MLMGANHQESEEVFRNELKTAASKLHKALERTFGLGAKIVNREEVEHIAQRDPFVAAFVGAYQADLMDWEEAMNRLVVALSGDRMMLVEKLTDAVVRQPVATTFKK